MLKYEGVIFVSNLTYINQTDDHTAFYNVY